MSELNRDTVIAELANLTPQQVLQKYVEAKDRLEQIEAKAAAAKATPSLIISCIDQELFRRKTIDGVANYSVPGVGTYTWAKTTKVAVRDYEGFLEFTNTPNAAGYSFIDNKVNEKALKAYMEANPDEPLEFAEVSHYQAPRFTRARKKANAQD